MLASLRFLCPLAAALPALVACGPEPTPPVAPEARWSLVHEDLPGALMAVWGTSASDVWAVGGDARDGTGPLVLHYDGSSWERLITGQDQVNLWWVFGFADGPVFMGGAGGTILRYEAGSFTPMATPGNGTVFGMWGPSPDQMWAVGGVMDKMGFAWRLSGDSWEPEPSLPAEVVTDAAIWKIFGTAPNDAWLVGSSGVSFHWDGSALSQEDTGVGSSLFTVHATNERVAAVGGFGTGIIVENAQDSWTSPVTNARYGLTGVYLGENDSGWAVGQYGLLYRRDASGWREHETDYPTWHDLHAVWIDPGGGAWAVGGQTASANPTDGVLIHYGEPVSSQGI